MRIGVLLVLFIAVLANPTVVSPAESPGHGVGPRKLRGDSIVDTSEERADITDLVSKVKYSALEAMNAKPSKLLKVAKVSNKPLNDNPTLMSWLMYAVKYRQTFGQAKFTDEKLFAALAKKLPEEQLAQLLLSMKKNPNFEQLANELLELQYARWLKTDMTSAKVGDILEAAKLSEKPLNDNPALMSWITNAARYRQIFGQAKFSDEKLFAALASKLSEEQLAQLLLSMKKNPNFEQLANELLELQYARWLSNGVTPAKVDEWLGLMRIPNSAKSRHNNPGFAIWREYFSRYYDQF